MADAPDTSQPVGETDGASPREATLNAQISRAIVKLVSEYTGRGPTRARTTVNGSLVACLLEDTLTKGERMLVANGQADAVLRTRESYQRAMQPDAVAAVERLTGRTVAAFMSTNHIDPDYGVEVFVLEDASPQTRSTG
jgi:uncharacterized protein YbcI